MALDPSIILGAASINDPNALLALKMNMQKMQAQGQQAQSQNALRSLLSNPGSYANGQLTPQAKQAVFAADPNLGLEVQRQDYNQMVAKAQSEATKTEQGMKRFTFGTETAGIAYNAYEAAKKAGKSEQEARQAGAVARDEAAEQAYKTGSGLLSADDLATTRSQSFDPEKAMAVASANKEWSANRAKVKTEELGEKRLQETVRNDDLRFNAQMAAEAGRDARAAATNERMMAALGSKPGAQETIKVKGEDGGISEVQAFVKGPGDVVDIAGNKIDPKTIVGASKIGSGGQPRSGSALAVQKYTQENPNATAADIQKFLARGAGQSAAFRSFMGGPDGKQLQSLGVATDHLMTLRDLNEAFKGGDVKMLAAAKARWETEFGTPAPSNIDVAAQFVAPELIKAIEGSSGGVEERAELVKKFSSARGQTNVDGAINTAFAYMGGQLQGMHQKLVKTEKIISDEEFNDAVPSVARDAMAKHATHSPSSLDQKGESLKFSSEEAAHKAAVEGKIKAGDIITIAGKKMLVQE